MLFYYIFGGVGAVALLVIIITLIKAAPRVTLIDTESLPKERAAQKKKEIINERFNRVLRAKFDQAKDKVSPVFSGFGTWGKDLVHRLTNMERRVERTLRTKRDPRTFVEELMADAITAMEKGEREEAERKLIEIVSVDAKHEGAYRMLGELYVDGRQYQEAWEVLNFLLKLTLRNACGAGFAHADPGVTNGTAATAETLAASCTADVTERTDIAKQYATLGEVAIALGKGEVALSSLEHAVAFESANPRYLDLLLEACILEKQKKRAKQVLAQLREVNPENNKLDDFAERITAIG